MSDAIYGKDIKLKGFDIQFSPFQDFAVITERNNLQQAIISRLLTTKGEYIEAGYGSEIYKIMGDGNQELIKTQLNGYIVEALMQEPRIKKIEEINLSFEGTNSNTIKIDLTVLPIDSTIPLNLIYPLFISG